MKRTKSIHHASFRKSWSARHLTPVALAVTAVFMLAGCEKSDETVSLYQNADDCSAANPGKSAECTTAFNNALKEAERTAPKYATREDCIAEFGEGQCQQAPAQAGMAPTGEGQAQAQNQSSGSFWMPLMAGYMMGRMMGGGMGAQQPLFSSKNPASPAYGKYTDAGGHVLCQVTIKAIGESRISCRAVISDNGIGMSTAFLPHLFESFSRENTDEKV